MHQVQLVLTHLYYGFSQDQLFVRLDFHPSVRSHLQDIKFKLRFLDPHPVELQLIPLEGSWAVLKNGEIQAPGTVLVAVDECFEAAIPFGLIEAPANAKVSLMVDVLRGDQVLDSRPQVAPFIFEVPSALYEADKWYV